MHHPGPGVGNRLVQHEIWDGQKRIFPTLIQIGWWNSSKDPEFFIYGGALDDIPIYVEEAVYNSQVSKQETGD